MTDIKFIENKITFIRNTQVILDRDLAALYEVETRVLKQAVRRNADRFPSDFMFQLTKEELEDWKSQTVMSKSIKQGLRHVPYAFTENGVAMLSSVLKSKKAIQINILIMRVFTSMRKQLLNQAEIFKKLAEVDQSLLNQDIINNRTNQQMKVIFEALKHVIDPPKPIQKKFGFIVDQANSK